MSANDVLSDAIAARKLTQVPAETVEKPLPEPQNQAPGQPESPQVTQPPHNLPQAIEQFKQPWLSNHVPTLRLCAIRIQGLREVRPSFLSSLCRPYVDPSAGTSALGMWWYGDRISYTLPGEATSFQSLLDITTAIGADLARLDLAKDIAASLEPSQLSHNNPAEDVDIVLKIKPTKRFFLRTNTSVGQSEGTASIQGKIRNVFGGAETLEGSASLGTRTRHAYSLVFTTPVLGSPDVWASVSALAHHRDMTSYLSAHEGQHAVRAACMMTSPEGIRNEIAYEASHRYFHHLLPNASIALRRLAKPSFKSAFSYLAELDTRDDTFMASKGHFFRGCLEFAAPGGDTSFLKAESFASISRSIGAGWAWSLGFRSGWLHTLDGKPASLSDRFMLGGPTDLRMFRINSLGPRQNQDALGGDAFWAAGASLLAPIPTRSDWPLKFHAFFNAGQLTQAQSFYRAIPTSYSELWQPSASMGVGLLFQQGPVRLELNFGLPILARRSDGTRKGLQFGLGLEFL
ncbi:hypothetical protein MYAM1_002236 [Malassezia yamatoensis]|uniref:Bacterial surface antigen (D15) domain-containing protein n=1 Tax=Malassezia yamatoensis TaxID=253288 RepID=A0AAJ6CJ40_9BASI|nr:hypothetical protein MYAM1_002236 [Malassezia yamatoensis]